MNFPVIHWTNGGWLDHSHFCCAEFNYNGYTSFTSDKGYNYHITLRGQGGCGFCSALNSEDEEAEQDDYADEESESEDDEYQDEDYEDQQ